MPDPLNSAQKEIARFFSKSPVEPVRTLFDRISSGGDRDDYVESDLDDERLSALALGIDLLSDAFDQESFDSASERVAAIETFLRAVGSGIRSLAVVPTLDANEEHPTLKVKVFGTLNHPISFRGGFFAYEGCEVDLSNHYDPATDSWKSYVPDALSGDQKRLLLFDPHESQNIDPKKAILIETDQGVIADASLWPSDKIPLAVLTLNASQADTTIESPGVGFDSILDARPFISWGGGGADAIERKFSAVAGTTRYFLNAGDVPQTPYADKVRFDRNGQAMFYGDDFTMGYDAGTDRYYIDIAFGVETGEKLRAWFFSA